MNWRDLPDYSNLSLDIKLQEEVWERLPLSNEQRKEILDEFTAQLSSSSATPALPPPAPVLPPAQSEITQNNPPAQNPK